ncbi:hypothetical protein M569_07551 [Genlisea aurea]|uniref:OCEL domain-containing protein n=1 Tax=Genlisea aurea TaxID=192259 RepID=S8DVK1_9LAMI|nr:hypothetical protein M569_07551 [Genlisea aurea]
MNHHEAPEQQGLSKLSSTEAVTKTQEKVALGVIPVLTAEDVEKIDILSNSPQHSHEKKILNNDDGVASSSDTAGSGTDSDSDISETDSDSGSNSRSKSGSQCSTDAQSDASDEEVDILTRDDDKEPLHKLCDSGAPSFKSPVDIGDNGRNDAFVHGMIGIGNDLPQVGDNAEVRPTHLFRNEEGEEHVEQMQSSADHHGQDRGQIRGKIVDKAREPGAHDRSLIGGSKRHFDDAHCDVKARNGKRFKSENSSHPVSGTLNSIFGDSPVQSPDRGIANPIVNGTSLQNGTNGRIVQPDYNEVIPNSLVSDTQQVNQRSSEAVKLTDGRKKAFKNELHGQASKYSENIQFRGGSGDKKFDGKGRVLQRELSDLELGELRETETPEDKSPFKHPEEKPYDKFDEAEKLSPGNQEAVNSAIADPLSKRKATEHNANHMKPLHRDPQPQHQSFGKHVEVPEINGKARASEVGANTKSHGDTGRKLSTDTVGRNSSIPPISGTQVAKENRKQGHDIALSNGKRKRASITTGINEGGGERKNSLDEVVCSYIKYEKLEPELKGPIKDTSRYQNYVKEYQEKYESYSSLHKILELYRYRNKFSKLDKELVDCKGQDKKKCAADILKQVVSLYNECGENFKRLKKIFLVLHVELQHLKKMMKDFAASYQNT